MKWFLSNYLHEIYFDWKRDTRIKNISISLSRRSSLLCFLKFCICSKLKINFYAKNFDTSYMYFIWKGVYTHWQNFVLRIFFGKYVITKQKFTKMFLILGLNKIISLKFFTYKRKKNSGKFLKYWHFQKFVAHIQENENKIPMHSVFPRSDV